MTDPFEKFYSSCFFKIPSGEWNPSWTAEVKDSRVPVLAGDYLSGYPYRYPILINEGGTELLTYTAEQAVIMNKIVLAKVKAGFSFNQDKGVGFVSVLNARDKFSDGFVDSAIKAKIETLIQTGSGEIGPGFTTRVEAREYKKYLQDAGLWDLTDDDAATLTDTTNLEFPEFYQQKEIGWPDAMLYFPIGDVEIVLKDPNGNIKGWLTYYQTLGSQNKLLDSTEQPHYGFSELSDVPNNAVYDRYGDLILYNAFGKWYTSEAEQQADIDAGNWYRSETYKNSIASRALVPCSVTIPVVPEPPPPPPPPPQPPPPSGNTPRSKTIALRFSPHSANIGSVTIKTDPTRNNGNYGFIIENIEFTEPRFTYYNNPLNTSNTSIEKLGLFVDQFYFVDESFSYFRYGAVDKNFILNTYIVSNKEFIYDFLDCILVSVGINYETRINDEKISNKLVFASNVNIKIDLHDFYLGGGNNSAKSFGAQDTGTIYTNEISYCAVGLNTVATNQLEYNISVAEMTSRKSSAWVMGVNLFISSNTDVSAKSYYGQNGISQIADIDILRLVSTTYDGFRMNVGVGGTETQGIVRESLATIYLASEYKNAYYTNYNP